MKKRLQAGLITAGLLISGLTLASPLNYYGDNLSNTVSVTYGFVKLQITDNGKTTTTDPMNFLAGSQNNDSHWTPAAGPVTIKVLYGNNNTTPPNGWNHTLFTCNTTLTKSQAAELLQKYSSVTIHGRANPETINVNNITYSYLDRVGTPQTGKLCQATA